VQRAHELEQQLLSLAQQSDHMFTSTKDLQNRHDGKLQLMDQTLEGALQRLSHVEEGLSCQLACSGRMFSVEARLEVMERRHHGFSATELAPWLLTAAGSSKVDLQALEERVAEQSRELSLSNEMLSQKVDNLMQQVTWLASGADAVGVLTGGVQTTGMSAVADLDVAELQRRLARLKSPASVSDLFDFDGQQPRDAMRDLVQEVGRLKLQATSDEATLFSVENRLQQIQYMVQQCCRWTEQDSPGTIITADAEVKELPGTIAKEH